MLVNAEAKYISTLMHDYIKAYLYYLQSIVLVYKSKINAIMGEGEL